MDTPFSARNVTKYVAKAIIHSRAAQLTEDIITDHSQFEDNDTVVRISSNLVGWYVSDKLKPVTDKMVDKTADFIAAKRAKKDTQNDSQ